MTVMLVFVLEFVESFVFCWGVVQELRGQDKGSRWSKKPNYCPRSGTMARTKLLYPKNCGIGSN